MFTELTDWIKQMIYLLVFLTLLLQILPNGNYKKYVRFFAGMIFVATLASPIVSMLSPENLESQINQALESADGEWGLNTQDFQSMETTRENLLEEYAGEYASEE